MGEWVEIADQREPPEVSQHLQLAFRGLAYPAYPGVAPEHRDGKVVLRADELLEGDLRWLHDRLPGFDRFVAACLSQALPQFVLDITCRHVEHPRVVQPFRVAEYSRVVTVVLMGSRVEVGRLHAESVGSFGAAVPAREF